MFKACSYQGGSIHAALKMMQSGKGWDRTDLQWRSGNIWNLGMSYVVGPMQEKTLHERDPKGTERQ